MLWHNGEVERKLPKDTGDLPYFLARHKSTPRLCLGHSIATRAVVSTIWVLERDGTVDKSQKDTKEMAIPGEMTAP